MDEKSELNQVLITKTQILSNATEALNGLVKDIAGLFEELSAYFTKRNEKCDQDLLELEKEHERINNYINQVHKEIPTLTKLIHDSKNELQEYEQKLKEIQENAHQLQLNANKWQKNADESSNKCEEAMNELNMQSTYTAAMGAVLGTMLWKTSKTQDVIETYIATGTLNQFLNLADNTLKSFKETYTDQLPMPETHEFKFLVSIYGISINILAQRIGRDFLLERENGLSFIRNSLIFLGEIPNEENLIKQFILMLAYNLSITNRGARFIQITEMAISNILKCYNENHSTDVQLLAIRLMTSLISEIPTPDFCENVMDNISQYDLEHLMNSSDENLKQCCTIFVEKLRELLDG